MSILSVILRPDKLLVAVDTLAQDAATGQAEAVQLRVSIGPTCVQLDWVISV